MKRLLSLRNFAVFLLMIALLAGVAADTASAAGYGRGDKRFEDKTWDQVVEDFLTQRSINPDTVGIAYYNTVTGEEHSFHGGWYWFGAGFYKVPLNMYFAERVYLGEMSGQDRFGEWTYDQIQTYTLEYSNDELCELLQSSFADYDHYLSAIRPYLAAPEDDFNTEYTSQNSFTPNQMLRCLKLLASAPERFPNVLEHLKNAKTAGFFRTGDRHYDIAHNHGYYYDDGYGIINDSAIIYTDEPIVLVMMTKYCQGETETVAAFGQLMCEYTQYTRARRLAEEAEKAEAEARAAEEAARAEEEARRAAEEAALAEAAAAEAEANAGEAADTRGPEGRTGTAQETEEFQKEPSGATRKEIIIVLLVILVFLLALVLIRSVKRSTTGTLMLILIALLTLTAAGCGRVDTPPAPAPTAAPAQTASPASNSGEPVSDATQEPVPELLPVSTPEPTPEPTPELVPVVTLTGSGVEEIAALARYRGLEYVDATASAYYPELIQAQMELPNVVINWVVDLGGVPVHSTETDVYLAGAYITPEELNQKLHWLPNLQKLDITGMDWTNEQSLVVVEGHPEIKVVWPVHFQDFVVPSNITCFSSLQWEKDPRHPLEEYLPLLTYCTDLVALDLGHNKLTSVEPIGKLTKLKVLILADNPDIEDLSPLANLTELEYFECFICYKPRDFSFLKSLTKMRDLNMCYCGWLDDPSFLDYMPDLQYCWLHATGIGYWEWDSIQAAYPNVKFVFHTPGSSTTAGWRATPDNLAIRQAFTYWKDVVEFRDIYDVTFREGVYIPEISPSYV